MRRFIENIIVTLAVAFFFAAPAISQGSGSDERRRDRDLARTAHTEDAFSDEFQEQLDRLTLLANEQAEDPEDPQGKQLTVEAIMTLDVLNQSLFDPLSASINGHREFDAQIPEGSPEAAFQYRQRTANVMKFLYVIDEDTLTPEERLDLNLLKYELKDRQDTWAFRPELEPISAQRGIQVWLPQLPERISFTTEQHYEDYVTRLEAAQGLIQQTIKNMRLGMSVGRTPPGVTLRSVPDQIRAISSDAQAEDPTTHPMYAPFLQRGKDDELAERAQLAIKHSVIPAFRELGEYMETEYIPECRETIGARDSFDGLPYYESRVRHYTTTNMTAKQVHDAGRAEVARIKAEMLEVIAQTDYPYKDRYEGEALLQAFIEFLRTDPRFYYDDPESLLAGYRDIGKRMDAELPILFGTLPELPWGVRAMPHFMSEAAPTAYYYPGSMANGVSGTFVANVTKLDQRPKYDMVPLTLHEAVPGHHLQTAIAQELADQGVHEWRTTLGYTAYVEGWALYAERLGLEVGGEAGSLGMYSDPYDNFGRLSFEMWRALRLVVDTGIHAFGWTRDQAIDYMLANSALSEANIISEVDRYISWPGQALGYKIGEMKIRELRARAEETLGDRFDIRDFHDVVLGAGAIPLSVLETRVDEWIAATDSD